MKKYTLEIIVFICGAVVMILELVGSRILAPYLGTSLVVWTSLIGIILGSLSLGYWWGGKMADRRPSYRTFSLIIFFSALLVGVITFVQTPFLDYLQRTIDDLYAGALLATLLLFALPSVLLGMISPYAVKLKMKDLESSGATVGGLYAVSTIGSIAGTFLAGFFLLSYFGSANILVVLSVVLTVTSLFAFFKSIPAIKAGIVLLLTVGFFVQNSYSSFREKQGTIDVDTRYNRVLIYSIIEERTGRPVRLMVTNPKEAQSAMYLDEDNDLVLEYTRFYRLAGHFKPDLRTGLMIGGAGYSFPKDYLKRFRDATLDVVEIDPGFTALARRYFNLKDDPRLTIYHEDGRTFLNKTHKKYDVFLGDAYRSFYSLPYQLTTVEAVRRIYSALTDDGVAMVNMISSIEGDKGRFLRAEYATFRAVFPQVYLFPVKNPTDGLVVQNIMLVALKSKEKPSFRNSDPELNAYLHQLWTREIALDMPLLTDDYAPVDNYMIKVIKESLSE